jgi:hypothetical protein
VIESAQKRVDGGAMDQYGYLRLAQAHAIRGDVDLATRNLAVAIQRGYRDARYFRDRSLFEPVLDSPMMLELLAKLEADNAREWLEMQAVLAERDS